MSASDTEHPALKVLERSLEEENVTALLKLPVERLRPRYKRALAQLSEYFNSERDTSDEREVPDGGERPTKRKKTSGRSANHQNSVRPRHRWLCIMNLQEVTLHPEIEHYLQTKDIEPQNFLSDRYNLHLNRTDLVTDGVGDAFLRCYQYTLQLDHRQVKDHFRWIFTMLWYFDLGNLIRPGKPNGRLGPLTQKELLVFLGPVLDSVSKEEIEERIPKWYLIGKNINHLCDKFGPGCLFFLHDQLSRNFLENRFTSSGRDHDEACAQLESLHLGAKSVASGADQLGQAIRNHFIGRFEEAFRLQQS